MPDKKPLASEVFAKLAPVVGDDEARALVKGKIEKGDLEDDLGVAPVISKTHLNQVLEGLAKAFTADKPPQREAVAILRTGKALGKGNTFVGNEPAGVDLTSVEDAISSLETKIEGQVESQTHQYGQLAKGLAGISEVAKAVFMALAEMDSRSTEQARELATMRKAVESIAKGGPKALQTGTAVIPHGSENPAALAAAQAAVAAATGGVSMDQELALHAKLETHINNELLKADLPPERRTECQMALGLLISGELPSQVNKHYKFGVS